MRKVIIASSSLALVVWFTLNFLPVHCAPQDHSGSYAAGMLMKGCK